MRLCWITITKPGAFHGKHEGGGGGISYTFIGVVMGQQTGPEATKAVPATIEMREPRPSAKEIEDGAAHAD